ncbi:MAG: translocation/assembly module TamB domain-containing protein [Parvularculaceae bacterium]
MALAAASAFFYLFHTPMGRKSIISIAEARLSALAGGEVIIDKLAGALPGKPELSGVHFNDADSEWLEVKSVSVDWRPLAFLDGRIRINSLSINGVTLSAPPPAQEKSGAIKGFELPEDLPDLDIDTLSIANIEVDKSLTGSALSLSAMGKINSGGRLLHVDLNAKEKSGRDLVTILVDRKNSEKRLDADIRIKSDPDGAIASLIGADGPVSIEAKGDGLLDDFHLAVNAIIGAAGQAGGALSGDLTKMKAINFDLEARPGERFASLKEQFGRELRARGVFKPAKDGASVEVGRLTGDFGSLAGDVAWKNRGDKLSHASAKVSVNFKPGWRDEIDSYIGDRVVIEGVLKPHSGRYELQADLSGEKSSVSSKKAETDLKTYIKGPINLTLARNDALPEALSSGAAGGGNFDLKFDGIVSVDNLDISTNDGARFTGEGSWNFMSETFSADGTLTAPPKLISDYAPDVKAAAALKGDIAVNGAADNFALKVDIAAPALLYKTRTVPPVILKTDLQGLPVRPVGKIDARSRDGASKLVAAINVDGSGVWRVNGLNYTTPHFSLNGSAAANPKTNEVSADLIYEGDDAAEPWPGLDLTGDLKIKGALSKASKTNRIAISSSRLKMASLSVDDLNAEASGDFKALNIKANASTFYTGAVKRASDITLVGIADLRNDPSLTLNALDAKYNGLQAKLLSPAKVSFSDGVEISSLRALLGRRGRVALDGVLSPTRWQAAIKTSDAALFDPVSTVDLNLVLDTDKEIPANGALTLRSQLTKTEQASLAAKLLWDGETLALRAPGDQPDLHLNLSLPLRLTRTPKIAVSSSGALDGALRYKGRLETLAAFMPAAFQSMDGDLEIDTKASGTTAAPMLTGSVKIANGTFTELQSGLTVVNIDASATARASAEGSEVKFTASGAGPNQKTKTVKAEGTVKIADASSVDAKLMLDKAVFSAGPVQSVEASGEIDLKGPLKNMRADGSVNVASLSAEIFTPESTGLVDIDVVAVDKNGKPKQSETDDNQSISLSYDINIKSDGKIFIRGRGLESEWRANASLTGTSAAPLILGSMTLRRGDLEFAGRRFNITEGSIAFDRLAPNNPVVDIKAERSASSGITVAILFEGRALDPKVSLESSPPKPQDEIMALLLFDKSASELTAVESLQVANALARLGGVGPFKGEGLVGSARQAIGLDLLNFNIDQNDAAASTLTVGKYVTDGLFVSATQDARGQSGSVRVEYEIKDNFTIETELKQDGDQTVSANWKRDF